jgi:hypothetical protein
MLRLHRSCFGVSWIITEHDTSMGFHGGKTTTRESERHTSNERPAEQNGSTRLKIIKEVGPPLD